MVKFVKINIDWSQQAVGQASICFCSSKMQLPQGKAYTISYYLCPIPPTHQKQVSSNQLPEPETCSPRPASWNLYHGPETSENCKAETSKQSKVGH